MILVELTLVLVYTSVLLIKACNTSTEVCRTFGLGDTSDGVYVFFVFFALGLVFAVGTLAVAKLYITGNAPKMLMLAQAHSVPMTTIVLRVAIRK